MTGQDPFFQNIEDPMARKRALAAQAGKLIDDVIQTVGIPADVLKEKLRYVREAIERMKELS